jgi:L-amino acid N-acyltransferase YncA
MTASILNCKTRKLVAEDHGVVVGCAYEVPCRQRPAHHYAITHSIYMHSDRLHGGHPSSVG